MKWLLFWSTYVPKYPLHEMSVWNSCCSINNGEANSRTKTKKIPPVKGTNQPLIVSIFPFLFPWLAGWLVAFPELIKHMNMNDTHNTPWNRISTVKKTTTYTFHTYSSIPQIPILSWSENHRRYFINSCGRYHKGLCWYYHFLPKDRQIETDCLNKRTYILKLGMWFCLKYRVKLHYFKEIAIDWKKSVFVF